MHMSIIRSCEGVCPALALLSIYEIVTLSLSPPELYYTVSPSTDTRSLKRIFVYRLGFPSIYCCSG